MSNHVPIQSDLMMADKNPDILKKVLDTFYQREGLIDQLIYLYKDNEWRNISSNQFTQFVDTLKQIDQLSLQYGLRQLQIITSTILNKLQKGCFIQIGICLDEFIDCANFLEKEIIQQLKVNNKIRQFRPLTEYYDEKDNIIIKQLFLYESNMEVQENIVTQQQYHPQNNKTKHKGIICQIF
ncbi:hypothetical protein pb186bvf_002456 [Paramecium bursaria]